jgi:hypothetical protein
MSKYVFYDEISEFTPRQQDYIVLARRCGKTNDIERRFKDKGFIVRDRGDSFELIKNINGREYHQLVTKLDVLRCRNIGDYSNWVEQRFLQFDKVHHEEVPEC